MKKYVFLFLSSFLVISLFSIWPGKSLSVFAGNRRVNVLILGDSLSAGLGVEIREAFPSLLQEMFNKKGLDVNVINGSVSGSTTAGASSRLKWFLKTNPDLFFLALGANDGLRGLPTDRMTQNLAAAIRLAQKNGITVILAGMKLPPNYGPDYARAFEASFERLAKTYDLPFIPFLLKNVAGHPSLNQADGIHPNAEGHKIIAATVFETLMEHL